MADDATLAIREVGALKPETSLEDTVRDRAGKGDRRGALELLMRTYEDEVFGFALRIVHDRVIAQDVLQQTFLEVHRDLATFSGKSSLRSWLLSITYHRAIDAMRRHRRETARTAENDLDELPDMKSGPDASIDAQRRLKALADCLQELPVKIRAAVLMRFKNGLAYEDMARTFQEKSGTLQARVARALRALRQCLAGKGVA